MGNVHTPNYHIQTNIFREIQGFKILNNDIMLYAITIIMTVILLCALCEL